MGRIEKSPVIGASCYLLTTATRLAGPLFLQQCVWGLLRCPCAYVYLRAHVTVCDIGCPDVKKKKKKKAKDVVLTLKILLYVSSGHGCGYNPSV